MSLPVWIRRLPHNLSTIRPGKRFKVDWLFWSVAVYPYFKANKGDKDYLFHFEETGWIFHVGPCQWFLGLIDTPEENAWIP